MQITFEGRTWDFVLEDIDLKQAIAIQLTYGFTLDDWYKALENSDARALQCLYWLMLQQAGEIKPIAECNCKIMALAEAMTAAMEAEEAAARAAKEAEQAAEVPAVPTQPAGAASSAPGSRPDTTRTHPGRREDVEATV